MISEFESAEISVVEVTGTVGKPDHRHADGVISAKQEATLSVSATMRE